MASFLNILIFQGNVGRDPEFTDGQRPLARFTVANTRVWTGQDGQRREETTWLTVKAWGRLAETARDYVRKGGRVAVQGRLAQWKSDDGATHHYMEATELHLQDAPRQDGAPPEPRRSPQARAARQDGQGNRPHGARPQGRPDGRQARPAQAAPGRHRQPQEWTDDFNDQF